MQYNWGSDKIIIWIYTRLKFQSSRYESRKQKLQLYKEIKHQAVQKQNLIKIQLSNQIFHMNTSSKQL